MADLSFVTTDDLLEEIEKRHEYGVYLQHKVMKEATGAIKPWDEKDGET